MYITKNNLVKYLKVFVTHQKTFIQYKAEKNYM